MAKRVMLALILTLAALGAAAEESRVDGQPALKRLLLADFEQPPGHPVALGWQHSPADTAFGLRYQSVPSDRPGGPGQALRVSYRLPTTPSPENPDQPDQDFGLVLHLLGLDASDYDHVSFWLKGDTTAGFNQQLEIKFRRPHPTLAGVREEGNAVIANVSDQWQQITVPLRQMKGINDWRSIESFSINLHSQRTAVRTGAYLVDDIVLLKIEAPRLPGSEMEPPAKKQAWETALGGETAAKPHLRARLTAWPTQTLVDPKTLPQHDRAFLRRVASDTWRGLDALTDREHGLPLDRIHFGNGNGNGNANVDLASARIGDYTSVTNIGFHLLAVAAAYDLKLIDKAQAAERLNATLTTLERLETSHGFFYNYYNTTTLERTSHFLSFVDSSWLTAGLIVIRQTFPALAERCTRLIDRGNYRFFYDPESKLMSHGYFVDTDQRSTYHYGTLYAESRIGSLIAIGKGDVEREHWFAMTRTLPSEYTWQTRQPQNRREKHDRGFRWMGGYYEWKEYRYVPSWGGSLFEALMPALVLDELRFAPNSFGRNGAVHTAIQRRYALEELAYPVWGMSPSSTPGSEAYAEYGVKFLGVAGYKEGVVTPHAAALALLTEPKAATKNLRLLAKRYPLYGEFGFYDAVDPKTGKVAYIYLCLNQAMILVALADHLADRAIQKRFASDPIIRPVLDLIGFENFFD